MLGVEAKAFVHQNGYSSLTPALKYSKTATKMIVTPVLSLNHSVKQQMDTY